MIGGGLKKEVFEDLAEMIVTNYGLSAFIWLKNMRDSGVVKVADSLLEIAKQKVTSSRKSFVGGDSERL